MAMVSRLDDHLKKGQSLARAAELIHIEDNGTSIADQIREQKVDWPEVVERFREQKVVTTGEITALTWVRRYRLIMDEFLQLMAEKRAPKTGDDVLETLVKRFAAHCPPGSDGRSRRFSYIKALLVFATTKAGGGAPDRWKPTVHKKALVGRPPQGSKKTPTALRDIDAIRVYEDFQDPKWKTAFGLCVAFGLRPAEVLKCRPQGGRLVVEGCKRNAAGEWGDREITGLDPVGAPGMARNLLAQLEERGADALPEPRVGYFSTRLRVKLMELETWQSLLKQTLAANKKPLTPYGARHSFAIRASVTYRLPLRVSADLCGHSLQVHLNHYGKDIEAERATDEVAAAYERVHGIPMPRIAAAG